MALPLTASPAPLERPVDRALRLSARITSPQAVESNSYLGGFASGARLLYLDAREFVWWAPGALPTQGAFSAAFSAAFDRR